MDKNVKWSLHRSEIIPDVVLDHGVGRLDCDTDDILTDDDTIFCKNDPGAIDVSCVTMTPNSRDKQVIFQYIKLSLINYILFIT